MTCIIRKDNILCTDSLILNGGPNGSSIEYANKIKRNKIGTVAIVYCGNNYIGSFNEHLENISNIIYNSELNSKEVTLELFDKDFIEYLDSNKDKKEFFIIFFTKKHTYTIKTYLENIEFFISYNHELYYVGGGSDFLNYYDTSNQHPIELMSKVIENISVCNGSINVFDLNNLKEISL